jgi:hypothetical protein
MGAPFRPIIARSLSSEAIRPRPGAAFWIAARSLSSGGAFAPIRWLAMTEYVARPAPYNT